MTTVKLKEGDRGEYWGGWVGGHIQHIYSQLCDMETLSFIHIGGPVLQPPPPQDVGARSRRPLQTTTQHGSLDDKIGREINKC